MDSTTTPAVASPLVVSDSLGVALTDGAGLAAFGAGSVDASTSPLGLAPGVGVGDATKFGSAGTGVNVGDGDASAFLVFLQKVVE